jgi:hypothetical protein
MIHPAKSEGTSRLGGIMVGKFCQWGSILLCLFSAVVSGNGYAQSAGTASASTAPGAPYSPVVSFGTLPALEVTTPIPGSNHAPTDFNGDGVSDLLWYNPTLSEIGYWTMSVDSQGTVTRTGGRTFQVTPGYYVGAVGDFNGDGYADLVFTSANRDLYLWTNNQNGGFTSQLIGTYPSDWQLVGAGDIDGDGNDDLLWLNPSACEFAYWTMRGAVRTGYKIVPVTCGYYPMSVGYYSPSNRISILWTSAANDLYVWDSTPTGFKSYNLFPSGGMTYVWAFGGGFMGNGMGWEYCQPFTGGTPGCAGYGSVYSRTFDVSGNQTGFSGVNYWDGGASVLSSGGYIVEGNGINATALYAFSQGVSTLYTGGLALPNSNLSFTGNAPILPEYTRWTYPVGWWVVGAPGNGTIAPPWQ